MIYVRNIVRKMVGQKIFSCHLSSVPGLLLGIRGMMCLSQTDYFSLHIFRPLSQDTSSGISESHFPHLLSIFC